MYVLCTSIYIHIYTVLMKPFYNVWCNASGSVHAHLYSCSIGKPTPIFLDILSSSSGNTTFWGQIQLFQRNTHPFSTNDVDSSLALILVLTKFDAHWRKRTQIESVLYFRTGSHHDVSALKMLYFPLKLDEFLRNMGVGFPTEHNMQSLCRAINPEQKGYQY